jgi:hypothetical protein
MCVRAKHLGDQRFSGAGSLGVLSDALPAGLKAIAMAGTKPFKESK